MPVICHRLPQLAASVTESDSLACPFLWDDNGKVFVIGVFNFQRTIKGKFERT